MDTRAEINEFLTSARARIASEQVVLTVDGSCRAATRSLSSRCCAPPPAESGAGDQPTRTLRESWATSAPLSNGGGAPAANL
jgi:hypothetical protein